MTMTSSIVSDAVMLPETVTQEYEDIRFDPEDVASEADELVMRRMLEEFRSQLLQVDEPRSAVLIGVYIPLFVCSVVGNIFVLVIVLPFRRMRNVTHCFIVNLAVSDLLLTLICVPTSVGQSVYKVWLYGETMCKITGFMQGLTVSSSVFTIAILSADRLLAIRRPMSFRIYRAGRHAWVIVAVVWIASVAVASPLLDVRQLDVVTLPSIDPLVFCHEKWPTQWRRRAYDITLFVLLFAVPGMFIVFSYALIGRQLWIEDSALYGGGSGSMPSPAVRSRQTKRILSGRRRIARMLGAIAVAFAVCWMPYQLLSLYIDFIDSSRDKSTKTMAVAALPFTILLGHSNSAFNPLLYCAMNYHLHRRRRSQSQTPAPAGVAESKRPLKMAVAETGARAWHCRAAPLGKSSVNRNLPASREGQSQPANDVRKQNGVESNERAAVDSGECICKSRNGFVDKQTVIPTIRNSKISFRSIDAVVAAVHLTASIPGGYGTMQTRGQDQCDGCVRRKCPLIDPSRRRSSSTTDGCDTATTAQEPLDSLPLDDGFSGDGGGTRSHHFRRASLGSPTSTTITATSSIASSLLLVPPLSPPQHHGAFCGGPERMKFQLDIPTTIREESSSRGAANCLGTRSTSPRQTASSYSPCSPNNGSLPMQSIWASG